MHSYVTEKHDFVFPTGGDSNSTAGASHTQADIQAKDSVSGSLCLTSYY